MAVKKRFLLLTMCFCIATLQGIEITQFRHDGTSWDTALQEARRKSMKVHFPPGEYHFAETINVDSGLILQFDDGVVLKSTAKPALRLYGGTTILEASGRRARLHSSVTGELHSPPDRRNCFIDLNHTKEGKSPVRLIMRNVSVTAYTGIDGALRAQNKGNIELIDISNCHFSSASKCIGIQVPVIGECRITNSVFTDADKVITLDAAIPGGAFICGNTVKNFGCSGIQIGKAGQVADGCTAHLPNAIIHDNRLLNGGRSTLKDAYTQGILVYGNNISVQGNIVRDVNRGKPVPGRDTGHQITAPDGTLLRGKTILVDGKRRRLAGAAIYLKANRAIVQGNICTNSGWRSVIEVKTGGKEYFTSVVNNIVDGKSLAVDESFAFECHSGRSLWANNIVYDVPHQAFVVRSGYENTFINNVISNAKIGFALSGTVPGQNELISGNRFINVAHPVAKDGKVLQAAAGSDVLLPPPARIEESDELPAPEARWHGRMLVQGDRIFLGVHQNGAYAWKELAGKVLPVKRYVVTGDELVYNSDQSGKEKAPSEDLADPAFPGWHVGGMQTANEKKIDPHSGCFTFDTQNTLTGGRSLKIMFPDSSGQWRLRQPVSLERGERYRATAVVRGDEPRNLHLEVFAGGRSFQVRAEDKKSWQTLTMDFQVPKKAGGAWISVWGSKTSPGKASWIDSVSIRKLREEGVPEAPTPVLADLNLAAPFTGQEGKLPESWKSSMPVSNLLLTPETDGAFSVARNSPSGNFLLWQKVKLKPGVRYRYEADWQAANSKSVILSVKPGTEDHVVRTSFRNGWNHAEIDFTAPQGNEPVLLRLWFNKLKAGEKVRIGKVLLRAEETKSEKGKTL